MYVNFINVPEKEIGQMDNFRLIFHTTHFIVALSQKIKLIDFSSFVAVYSYNDFLLIHIKSLLPLN